MKLGPSEGPLAHMPGSSVGNGIVYKVFVLQGTPWQSWSPGLQGAVATGRTAAHSLSGLCPLLPNHCSEPCDSSDLFSISETPSPLYQLFFLSHFLRLFCFLLLLVFPWPQCSHTSILFIDNFIHVSCFTYHLYDGNSQVHLSSLPLICNSRHKSSNILIPIS